MNYFTVSIDKTSRPMGRSGEFSRYDREELKFKTLQEVKEYLKNTYGSCKKTKMYQDNENESYQVGYIYSFNNYDWSRETGKKEHWTEQHWVEVDECKARVCLV